MKRVTLTEFRRHLAEHLRSVVAGETLVVTRRGRPVARVQPTLMIRPPQRLFSETAHRRYEPLNLPVSSTELVRQERGLR